MRLNQLFFIGLSLFVTICNASPARAEFLLDTGTPTGGESGAIGISHTAGYYQTLAAAFSTTEPEVVTSIEAYFNSPFGSIDYLITGRTIDNRPDVNNTLFSQTLVLNSLTDDWFGVSGLNWSLPAGDYYLVLSPQLGFNSSMPRQAPNPTLVPYTNNSDLTVVGGDGWAGVTTRDVGFRVSAVPEPTSLALLGLGGLIFSRRRR